MNKLIKRAHPERRGSCRQRELTQLAATALGSRTVRRDLLRLVVTLAATAVIIVAIAAVVLIVRPELVTAFVSLASRR